MITISQSKDSQRHTFDYNFISSCLQWKAAEWKYVKSLWNEHDFEVMFVSLCDCQASVNADMQGPPLPPLIMWRPGNMFLGRIGASKKWYLGSLQCCLIAARCHRFTFETGAEDPSLCSVRPGVCSVTHQTRRRAVNRHSHARAAQHASQWATMDSICRYLCRYTGIINGERNHRIAAWSRPIEGAQP